MRIHDICTRAVVTCPRHASAGDVARLMRSAHVGDVVVVDGEPGAETPLGVVTDRDLVVRVLARGVDAETVCAGDLIVGDPVTVTDCEDVHDAICHMRSRGVRRLPVVNSRNVLVGIVCSDDLGALLADELGALTRTAPAQRTREAGALDAGCPPVHQGGFS